MENPYPCALGAQLRRCFWGRPLRRPVFRAGSSSDGCRNFPRGAILSKSYCHARKLFGLGNIKELHGHASPAHAPTDPVGCNQCCRRMKYACLFCIVYSVPTQRSGEVLAPPTQCQRRVQRIAHSRASGSSLICLNFRSASGASGHRVRGW